jgi:hypothetical protein
MQRRAAPTDSTIISTKLSQIAPATVADPVVVDLGKTKKKNIRALKRGDGKLMKEVSRVMSEVRSELIEELAGKHLVPVVILYRPRHKRRSAFHSD